MFAAIWKNVIKNIPITVTYKIYLQGKKMKKILIILLFVIAGPLFAQLNYGVKAGLTSSNQTWEYVPKFANYGNVEPRKGINLGIFAEYSDNKYLGVLAEINYRQKGAKIDINYTGRDTSGSIVVPKSIEHKLSYINITLLGKVRYDLSFVTPYVIGGLKTDYQVSNKFDDVDLGYLSTECTTQIWGAVIGAGFEIKKLFPFALLAEFRYEFDFNKLYVSDDYQIKTSSFELKLGVRF
jgi:hypothetical protein